MPNPTKRTARAVRNYPTDLSVSSPLAMIQEKKRRRLAPDAEIEMPCVRFMLQEADVVVLAVRLRHRHSDEPNRPSPPASATSPPGGETRSFAAPMGGSG